MRKIISFFVIYLAFVSSLNATSTYIDGREIESVYRVRAKNSIDLFETGTGSDYVRIQSLSSLISSYTLTLPANDGNANDFLITDGSGVLSFSSGSSVIGCTYLKSDGTCTGATSQAQVFTQGAAFGTSSQTTISSAGLQKINVNSTSAFIVEQTGVNNNVFRVDTTNQRVFVNASAAPVSSADLYVQSYNPYGLWVRQEYLTTAPSGQTYVGNFQSLLQYTSSNATYDHIGAVMGITTARTLNAGTSDTFRGLVFDVSKQDESKVTSTILIPMVGSVLDLSTYNKSTGNQDVTTTIWSVDVTTYPTYDAATRTLTYNTYGTNLTGTIGGTEVAGTLNVFFTGHRIDASGFGAGTGKFTGIGMQLSVQDFNFNWGWITDADSLIQADNKFLGFGAGTGVIASETFVPDVKLYYNATSFLIEHSIVATGAATKFNSLLSDVDFEVYSDDGIMLHLDAGAGSSYFRPKDDLVTAFIFQNAAGNSHLTYDSTNAKFIFGNAVNITFMTTTGSKIGTDASEKIGFWGTSPVVRSSGWSVTNVTTDRTFDANSTTIDELADVLGTLIDVMKLYGLLGA